jgi:hypothetical protein
MRISRFRCKSEVSAVQPWWGRPQADSQALGVLDHSHEHPKVGTPQLGHAVVAVLPEYARTTQANRIATQTLP